MLGPGVPLLMLVALAHVTLTHVALAHEFGS